MGKTNLSAKSRGDSIASAMPEKSDRRNWEIDESRLELSKKFRAEHGSISAFCQKKGITPEWLRLLFRGEFENVDLLIEAAEFLALYKADKANVRKQKAQLLSSKVQELA